MLIIKENDIYLTRGDTAYIDLSICGDYKPQAEDKVYFSVKKKVKDTDYTFQVVSNFDEIIYIAPEDTKDLEYGRYLYDCEIRTAMGEVFTVSSGYFNLTEEITNE